MRMCVNMCIYVCAHVYVFPYVHMLTIVNKHTYTRARTHRCLDACRVDSHTLRANRNYSHAPRLLKRGTEANHLGQSRKDTVPDQLRGQVQLSRCAVRREHRLVGSVPICAGGGGRDDCLRVHGSLGVYHCWLGLRTAGWACACMRVCGVGAGLVMREPLWLMSLVWACVCLAVQRVWADLWMRRVCLSV